MIYHVGFEVMEQGYAENVYAWEARVDEYLKSHPLWIVVDSGITIDFIEGSTTGENHRWVYLVEQRESP
jgi:hypothetical protein